MNGFGHFLKRIVAFDAYWAAAALLLAVAGYLFWIRGTASDWRARLRIARARFTPNPAIATAPAAVTALTGGVKRARAIAQPRAPVAGRAADPEHVAGDGQQHRGGRPVRVEGARRAAGSVRTRSCPST